MAQGIKSYRFEVLPFGLCTAPNTFQALADRVFEGLKWKSILIYLDDVIIFSKTPEEHMQKLREVCERLREAGLTLNPKKCEFLKKEVQILGHVVNETGILPDGDKLESIKSFSTPRKVKDVQSFLGLANFYRKFIKDFSTIARPLHDLTKKDQKFSWNKEQEKAFQVLKEKLVTAPVLHHFNPEKGTILHVDGSKTGIGAVLLQEDDKGVPHPIAYASRSLNKNEKNYTISEIEGLAVVYFLEYLRHFIFGRKIRIISDHSALCWFNSVKNSGRLVRWSLKLSEFDYSIEHRKGCENKDADCLSRYPREGVKGNKRTIDVDEVPTFVLDKEDFERHQPDQEDYHMCILRPERVKELQQKDGKIRGIIEAMKNPENQSIAQTKRLKQFEIKNEVLYKINLSSDGLQELLVIPQQLIGEILFQLHCDPTCGHLGLTKTLHKIKSRFYWETLNKDVTKFVKGCVDCQARKGSKEKGAGNLQPIEIGLPFQKVGIELLGPFRKSSQGKVMIIVATCYATRYVETKALPSGKAGPVAKFILENIILRHGCFTTLVSDQGKTFQSELVQELLKLMGANSRFTTAYHPECNGLTERFNKTLADMCAIYTNTPQTDWCSYLPFIQFAYNTARQDTTKFSPFELVYGRSPVLPVEAQLVETECRTDAEEIRQRALALRSQAVQNILKKQIKDKELYDKKHTQREFEVGDKVKIFIPIRKKGRSEKLLLRYFGPYYIGEKMSEVNYLIRKGVGPNAKTDVVHISRILPYHDSWTPGAVEDVAKEEAFIQELEAEEVQETDNNQAANGLGVQPLDERSEERGSPDANQGVNLGTAAGPEDWSQCSP